MLTVHSKNQHKACCWYLLCLREGRYWESWRSHQTPLLPLWLLSNITEGPDQCGLIRPLTDARLCQGELLALKHTVNGILPFKHGILEVTVVLLLLKMILESDSYQIINTCHCTYGKRKWNTFHVTDAIPVFCSVLKTTKHLTCPINGAILSCHVAVYRSCITLIQTSAGSC